MFYILYILYVYRIYIYILILFLTIILEIKGREHIYVSIDKLLIAFLFLRWSL